MKNIRSNFSLGIKSIIYISVWNEKDMFIVMHEIFFQIKIPDKISVKAASDGSRGRAALPLSRNFEKGPFLRKILV